MNTDKRLLLISIVVILGLIGCNIYLHLENDKLLKENNNAKEVESTTNKDNKETYYDCSFTKTYRVVDLLDNYVAEVPEMTYVVLDQFLVHGAYAHKISSVQKKKLEVNKYYEFTYTLKGLTKDKINDINDVLKYNSFNNLIKSDNSLRTLVEIKETDKRGLEQIQEDICKGV